MEKIKASVFILTKNSQATLKRALKSVQDFDDIVVCDGGSSDRTLEIARFFGARILRQPEECISGGVIQDFSCVRNECLVHTLHDWVLYVDSDEEVSSELVENIRKVASDDYTPYLVYRILAEIVVGEKVIKYSSNYPGWQTRFFNKKSGARFIKPVHERIVFDRSVAVGELRGPWRYFFLPDASDMEADLKKYIRLEVRRFYAEPFRSRLLRFFKALLTALKILLKSVRNYIFHGFHDTMPPRIEYVRIKYQILLGIALLTLNIK